MPHQIESIRAMIHPKKEEVSKIERKAKKQLVVLCITSIEKEKQQKKGIFFPSFVE